MVELPSGRLTVQHFYCGNFDNTAASRREAGGFGVKNDQAPGCFEWLVVGQMLGACSPDIVASELRSKRGCGVVRFIWKGSRVHGIVVFEVLAVCTGVSGGMQRGGHFAAGRRVGRDKLHTLRQAVVPYGPVQHVQACLGRAQVMVQAQAGPGATGQQALPRLGRAGNGVGVKVAHVVNQ